MAPSVVPAGIGQSVLIAGGGIAGLSTALALARHGIPSHVLEKRPQFAEEGAGIQLGPNGTRVLTCLGVADLLRPMVAAPDCLRVMDGLSGRQIARLPLGAWIAERHGAPYWTAHRGDLHAALLQAARNSPGIRISMNASAAGFEEGASRVALALDSDASVDGEVLIGADGLWSALREAVLPGCAEPVFTGRTAVRAVVPADALPPGIETDATHIWLRPGAHTVHYPVRAGKEIALVLVVESSEASDSWSTDVLPAFVRTRTEGFPEPLASLLARPKAWREWSLFALPGAQSRHWTSGRVALIGDAAHPVLPFLAQGGVLALEDAVVLGRCLAARRDDVVGALRDYERQRRPRVNRIARASRRNGRVYHLSGLLARARDALLSSTPPERVMAGFDWLYGWRA